MSKQFPYVEFKPIADMGKYKTVLLIYSVSRGWKHYFTDQSKALTFTENWGMDCDHLYMDEQKNIAYSPCELPTWNDIQHTLGTGSLFKEGIISDHVNIRIDSLYNYLQLLMNFSAQDEELIRQALHHQTVKIGYSDNYLNSLLGCQILCNIIQELQKRYELAIDEISFYLSSECCNPKIGLTGSIDRQQRYQWINLNFYSSEARNQYLQELVKNSLDDVKFAIYDYTNQGHYRWLKISPMDGQSVFELRPDGGIARGWFCNKNYGDLNYDADASIHIERNLIINNGQYKDLLYYIILKKKDTTVR